ncbi:hypothetical protein ACF0H5_011456 [Mactra antiquata]
MIAEENTSKVKSMSFLNCSRSREKVSSPTDSPPYDKEQYFKKQNVSSPVDSEHSSRGDFPNIMLEYGNEPLQYDLYATIGKGCNDAGTISVAKHIASGHNVAIRQVDLDKDLDVIALQREIVLCRQIHHESILPYYTSFVHNNEVWTVMPLMAYGSCRDLLHAYFANGLPEQAIAYILRDILCALDYLHGRGIIHRGVKASHILISAAGRVCLSGMRMACPLIKHGEWKKCVYRYPENAQKLLCWFSPEMLEQNLRGYDTKSDIYSVGITACELANGYPPFSDIPATEMLLEKLSGIMPSLNEYTTQPDLIPDENVANSEDSGKETSNTTQTVTIKRSFSANFHHFVKLCLERDPYKRPSAQSLLSHPFLKNLRKKSTSVLPSLLLPVTPLLDASKLPKEPVDNGVDKAHHVYFKR